MSADLKRKSVSAVAWSGMDALARQGLQFVISIVLARLLAPEEFGLLAMLSLFTGLATLFVDGGFTPALIQKRDLRPEETSSVFYFNLAMAGGMAVALCAASSLIAQFFDQPVLRLLTCVMALNLFLSSWGSVHWALLARDLDFRCQMRIGLIASAGAGGVAIVLAWRGFGVWSLAWSNVTSTVVSTALVWWWRPWRPRWVFRYAALRSLLRFGSYLFLSGLLDTAYTRLYTLVIGKFYSPKDLGYYTRADGTQQLPTNLLSGILSRVALPMFSAAAGDRDRLGRGLRKAVCTLMVLNLPMMLGLLAVSRSLVLTLFGEKWLPCVPYLRVLCLAGVFWPLHVINLTALNAMGRSDLYLRLEVIKKVLGFSALVLAASISVMAMAWSVALLGVVGFFLNAHYSGALLGYPALRQLRDLAPQFLMAGMMCLTAWLLGAMEQVPPPVILAIQVVAGVAVYTLLGLAAKPPAFLEVLEQLRVWLARALQHRLFRRPARVG